MTFTSQTTETPERFARLHDYMDQNVLTPNGKFVGAHGLDCCRSVLLDRAGRRRTDRVFAPGQLSHVGTHYALAEDGRALRILAIPMDTGGKDGGVTLETRREAVRRSAALDYRERNPHMRGTMNALRLAVGREPDTDKKVLITEHLSRGRIAGVKTLLAAFVHPSYRRRIWHRGHVTNVPYLWEVVCPTIKRARQELGFG